MNRQRIRYGSHLAQVGDLWRPSGGQRHLPVVVLIHGGFWKTVYPRMLMRGLARSVAGQGWAAWNIEYRRVGVLGRAGWPRTLVDVAAAIDHLADLDGIDPGRVVACGHSAGGQLALWAAARPRLAPDVPGANGRVVLRGAVSLAGVTDLVEADRIGLGDGAVSRFLGGRPDRVAERYRGASPLALLPIGVRQVLVHGLDDAIVPPSLSERYSQAAQAAGDDAVYVPVAGAGHRDVIDPRSDAWRQTVSHLERLLG